MTPTDMCLTQRAKRVIEMSRRLRDSSDPIVTAPLSAPYSPNATLLTKDQLEVARTRLMTQGYAHIRVPVQLAKDTDTGPVTMGTDVDLILQEQAGDQRILHFLRSDLWVKGEPAAGANVSARARMDILMSVPRPEAGACGSLSELLAVFEGPAHTDWKASQDQDRRPLNYPHADKVRKAVRRLPANIVNAVATHDDKPFDVAADWFPAPGGRGGGSDPGSSKSKGRKTSTPPKGSRPMLRATPSSSKPDSFTFTFQDTSPRTISKMVIRFAYALEGAARSTTLRHWTPTDFAFTTGRKSVGNRLSFRRARRCRTRVDAVDNELRCSGVQTDTFEVTVAGFGVERGIVWEATAVDAEDNPIPLRTEVPS